MLLRSNKNKINRNFNKGDIIYEKILNERNKLKPRYKKQKVMEDLGNKVRIYQGCRLIHKDNIK